MNLFRGHAGISSLSSPSLPLPAVTSLGLAILGLGVTLFLGCTGNPANAKTDSSAVAEAMPATVAVAVRKTVPVEVNAIGNVEAYSTVSVKALVSGELVEVHFQEGQEVNKGDLLFRIDPRPF